MWIIVCLSLSTLVVLVSNDSHVIWKSFSNLDVDQNEIEHIGRNNTSSPCRTGSNFLRCQTGIRETIGHPRVTCLTGGMQDCGIELFTNTANGGTDHFLINSIPTSGDSNDRDNISSGESRTVPDYYSDEECYPSYENLSDGTQSTCNDVHSMGLAYTSISGSSGGRGQNECVLKHIGNGNYNSVWKHESLEDILIMKMHRPSREFSKIDFDRNRRDVLISGRAGRFPNQYNNNVVPVFQYCGFTMVVPLANQTLDQYIKNYQKFHDGNLMGATEMFHLAIQAARSLYQAHLYLDGKATTAHSDVKPSQFILFQQQKNHSLDQLNSRVPILQINDFNRCRLLYRSKNNNTCPFRICGVKHKGSTYRSPEEYMDCADQNDSIDVFSLGGVYFYILSDGLDPYFEMDFDTAIKRILSGKLPQLPPIRHYEKLGENAIDFVKKRANHPAFRALQRIIQNCWRFKPEDRPSSLEVLKMFEAEARTKFMRTD
jgi:hypothetical protein